MKEDPFSAADSHPSFQEIIRL